jgi:hypothetical protein
MILGIITLFIGGTAFTFSQQDVVDNFATDTGMTQQQAEQYVNSVTDDELVPFDELGASYIEESKDTLSVVAEIDCDLYEYEWESPSLTCVIGKTQLQRMAAAERNLGQSYIRLNADSAGQTDMQNTIYRMGN